MGVVGSTPVAAGTVAAACAADGAAAVACGTAAVSSLRPSSDHAPNATRASAAAMAPLVAHFSHGAGTGRPYTSAAASRMKAGPTRCSSRVKAPSSARSQTTLITRGMPSLSRCTSRNAPGVNTSAVAPATRMRCLT